jgi:hypothetical protein
MRRGYAFNVRRANNWKSCFEYIFNKADNFSVIFQGDPNDLSDDGLLLNNGKKDFLSLINIDIKKYEGMENTFLVFGSLTCDVKSVFYKYIRSSFEECRFNLWSFELLLNNEILLQMHDYSECLLNLTDDEHKEILDMGVNNIKSYDFPMISFINLKKEDYTESNNKLNQVTKLIKDRFLKNE